jgi:pyruvate dehydrogenase E1 component
MRRMFEEGENCFYYITTMNENYVHPDMPANVEAEIVRGLYRLKHSTVTGAPVVQLLGAGAILREVEAAAEILEKNHGVAADIWSMTSVNELAREGDEVTRWNRLHPTEAPRVPYLTQQLSHSAGPFIAATDYQRAHTNQLREFIPGSLTVLGTDGFGRSDTRQQLRQHFEVSREHIVVAALKALADQGDLALSAVEAAILAMKIDPDKPNPAQM